MKLTRKKYERPKLELFELRKSPQILAGSVNDATRHDYNGVDEENWNN